MKNNNSIKKIAILFVFLLSFVFQTAYSLSFKVSRNHSADLFHKQLEKSSTKEEASYSSFIENENENDNELDFDQATLFVPQFFFYVVYETHTPSVVATPLALSHSKDPIFIEVRNFRI